MNPSRANSIVLFISFIDWKQSWALIRKKHQTSQVMATISSVKLDPFFMYVTMLKQCLL